MGIPKYQAVRNALELEILSGEFKPGDRFYTERELLGRFQVSSITVIRALKDLVDMGYLVRRQGVGTFITRARKRKQVEFSDIELFSSRAHEETVEVIRFEPGCDDAVRAVLGLAADEDYYHIERVRRVGGVAFTASSSHIPARYILRRDDPSYYESIYARFREDFGIELYDAASVEVNTIAFPIPARVAGLLESDVRTPCALQEKVTTLASGEVAEHVVSYKRWDYFKIKFTSPAV